MRKLETAASGTESNDRRVRAKQSGKLVSCGFGRPDDDDGYTTMLLLLLRHLRMASCGSERERECQRKKGREEERDFAASCGGSVFSTPLVNFLRVANQHQVWWCSIVNGGRIREITAVPRFRPLGNSQKCSTVLLLRGRWQKLFDGKEKKVTTKF